MKKGLLLLGISISFLTIYGQTYFGFGDGIIITKQGDSIKCQVEMAVTYTSKIAYRHDSQGEELFVPINSIKSLTTPFKYWENIQIGKKEKLMSLIVDGKARLFNHVTINPGASTPAPGGGTWTGNNAPTILYVLEKDGTFYELKKKNFKTIVETRLNGCQSVVDKVNSKEYKFEDIEKVITEYNSCR